METKKKYLLAILSLLLLSCASYDLSEDMQGVYLQTENKRLELHLNKESFVLKDNFEPTHLAVELYKCCDTITYGKWLIADGFLSLSSPNELSTFYLNMDIDEEEKPSQDSITFIIDNPIERYYKKRDEKQRELIYLVKATTVNGKVITKKTDLTNEINIKAADGINRIEITIYPKCDIAIRDLATREVFTLPYEVENSKASLFRINIPRLDYQYLAYKRLDKDYVKIIGKNKLLWEGKEYVRK